MPSVNFHLTTSASGEVEPSTVELLSSFDHLLVRISTCPSVSLSDIYHFEKSCNLIKCQTLEKSAGITADSEIDVEVGIEEDMFPDFRYTIRMVLRET